MKSKIKKPLAEWEVRLEKLFLEELESKGFVHAAVLIPRAETLGIVPDHCNQTGPFFRRMKRTYRLVTSEKAHCQAHAKGRRVKVWRRQLENPDGAKLGAQADRENGSPAQAGSENASGANETPPASGSESATDTNV